jgi:hypothetical protein
MKQIPISNSWKCARFTAFARLPIGDGYNSGFFEEFDRWFVDACGKKRDPNQSPKRFGRIG